MSETPAPANDSVVAYLRAANECCPSCRYELKGAATDRCPECGTTLQVQLITSVGSACWWWTALLGTIVGTAPLAAVFVVRLYGIAGLADQQFFRAVRQRGVSVTADLIHIPATLVLALFVVMHLALLAWLIAGRRAWGGWSARRRVLLGVLGASMPLITFVLILVYINV